jgi:hypothetical protein
MKYNFNRTGKPKEKITTRGYPQPPEKTFTGDPWEFLLGERDGTWEDVPHGDNTIDVYKRQKPELKPVLSEK